MGHDGEPSLPVLVDGLERVRHHGRVSSHGTILLDAVARQAGGGW
jgi:hypothetical protein